MTRVAVIGAGVSGLVSAWALTSAGVEVVVYDADDRGAASPVAAGMLAPGSELTDGESELYRVGAECVRLWPDLAARLEADSGIDVGLRTEGTLLIAHDLDEVSELERHEQRLRDHGTPYRRLDRAALRALEPAVLRSVKGAAHLPGDLSVDTTAVLAALRKALRHNGVRINADRVQLACHADRVVGVSSSLGEERYDCVVLAAGAHSNDIASGAGVDLPVRPVKGELLRLRVPYPVVTHTLRARVDGVEIYVVPRRHGEIVLGASSVDCGFDTDRSVRAALDLLRAATLLVPELRDAEIVSHDVGLRPGTPDNAPYLGPAREGLVAATGHYRHGYLLAPATALAVVRGVLAHESPALTAQLSPIRHHDRGDQAS
ncbi:glycine oxidase ThiO [Luteipulveratus halotolerans]|uniref:glycine oxidase n=1 Tax=Luteipulveratus halotolerans TaxID=1631356 RepID=A0A0L6CGY9_9MICO|nr:glycine oxidase ThiO [Luteipulveratus halotolerans]KNX37066.1 hypothetical protein VV01_07755 [Luteipulveratus halotolerans]